MPASFRELFATFGVDDDVPTPTMIVPWHGFNLVALEGGPDLTVVPVKDIVTVTKLAPEEIRRYILLVSHLTEQPRGTRPLGKDANVFHVKGNRVGGASGTVLNAVNTKGTRKVETSMTAVVLGKKPVKIAIRPVKVRDEKGNWVFHATNQFDEEDLRSQMNAIWTPQSNVEFNLVSKEPLLLDDPELSKEIQLVGTTRERFLETVHMQAFLPMFKRNVEPTADLTFFVVKSIFDQRLGHPSEPSTSPAGDTVAADGVSLVCDQIAARQGAPRLEASLGSGIVLAHEAGHFMGFDGHEAEDPKKKAGVMLMLKGGPFVGFGKVTVARTLQYFNNKY